MKRRTNSLGAVSGVNNNFNFAFRIVSEFENTASGGGTANYVTTFGTKQLQHERHRALRFSHDQRHTHSRGEHASDDLDREQSDNSGEPIPRAHCHSPSATPRIQPPSLTLSKTSS